MAVDTLRRLAVFFSLILVQGLVFGRIHLYGVATPLFYVYFAIILPRNYPRWASLLWCFLLGLGVDIFSNTPGVAAASMTVIGMVQPWMLELFVPRDAADDLKSSASTLGNGKFATFSFFLVLIYCLLFYTLETFSFFDWQHWLLCVVSSTLLTYILVITQESIRR